MLLLGAFLAACGCSPAPTEGRGSVLLLVIDELRADHCSALGYDRATTPKLDALARQGVLFEAAFSTAPWNVPAHVSVLTGCDPSVAERELPEGAPVSLALRWRLPRAAPSLPEELLRAGYSTAAFVDDPLIGPALGFTRGFQHFDLPDGRRADESGARGVFARLRKWLVARAPGEPWFAYVQLSDLTRTWWAPDPQWDRRFEPRDELDHAPPVADAQYAFFAIPRRRWLGAYGTLGEYEARYDGALAKLDVELGALFEELRARRDFADLTIVVASSHGISFGEGGLYVDHGALTDADLRSLLIVRPSDRFVGAARDRRVPSAASLIDIAPTALALCGIDPPPTMHGLSWRDVVANGAEPAAEFAERRVFARYARQDGVAVMDRRYSYAVVRPWIAEPAYLRRSWYGGPLPADPRPVERLVERSPAGVGSLLEVVDPALRAGFEQSASAWFARVERARERYNPREWFGPEAPSTEDDDAQD